MVAGFRTDAPAGPDAAGGPRAWAPAPAQAQARIRANILAGVAVVLVFVVGLGAWAALAPVAGAVQAAGVVKVENNRKSVRRLEPGVLTRILVREGDRVRAGQLLFLFDAAQPRSQLEVLETNDRSLLAEHARFEAEATGRSAIAFPPELLAARGEPGVAEIIDSERALFQARRETLDGQVRIGQQRVAELGAQIGGVHAQLAASDAQLRLNQDELSGVQRLYDDGYAPKTRLLNLQRSAANLQGSRGEQVADAAKAEQTIGETRLQMLNARQSRIAEAAAGLQDTQNKLAEIGPKLVDARYELAHTEVRSPVDGVVLNLTQFTEGSAVAADELLLDVVPQNAPLVIEAKVRPQDAHAVKPGQRALVTILGLNRRTMPRIEAQVIAISPDQTVEPKGDKAFFTAQLRVPPDELRRLPPDVKLQPGMPLSLSIVNGERTVLGYLLQPLVQALRSSMHEE